MEHDNVGGDYLPHLDLPACYLPPVGPPLECFLHGLSFLVLLDCCIFGCKCLKVCMTFCGHGVEHLHFNGG